MTTLQKLNALITSTKPTSTPANTYQPKPLPTNTITMSGKAWVVVTHPQGKAE